MVVSFACLLVLTTVCVCWRGCAGSVILTTLEGFSTSLVLRLVVVSLEGVAVPVEVLGAVLVEVLGAVPVEVLGAVPVEVLGAVPVEVRVAVLVEVRVVVPVVAPDAAPVVARVVARVETE
jgi:hypothetical protein